MKRAKALWTGWLGIVVLLLLFCSSMLTAGCQSHGSGFLREEFLTYRKIAILPFQGDPTGETCQNFAFRFKEKFREMEVFDQYRLLQLFNRQALYPNELTEETRARIGRALGAQAVIAGSVYYASITYWYLQVRVIDTETGRTMGTSYVEVLNMGEEGMEKACELAVRQLTSRK